MEREIGGESDEKEDERERESGDEDEEKGRGKMERVGDEGLIAMSDDETFVGWTECVTKKMSIEARKNRISDEEYKTLKKCEKVKGYRERMRMR